jgi:hypothetical protein
MSAIGEDESIQNITALGISNGKEIVAGSELSIGG